MSGQTCNGCVGCGTGDRCGMCSLPIPAGLRRGPNSPSEFDPTNCADCRQGRRHSHTRDGAR